MQSEESDREAFRQDVVALARQINADIAARRAARAVREAAINKELSDLRRQIRVRRMIS